MPRNGSSVYSLPAGNPVVSGTVIATTWANTTLTDIATALTNSLSTDGSTASVSLSGKTMSGGTFSGPTVTSVLTLTGGQIAFPAVQVPSAGANVLDDYEEGTWTPVITFATPGNVSVTYSTQVGKYTKIGNMVHLQLNIVTSTFTETTAAGDLRITGLPFTPANNTGMAVGTVSGLVNAGTFYQTDALINASVPCINVIFVNNSGGTEGVVSAAEHTSGVNCGFAFTGTYLI